MEDQQTHCKNCEKEYQEGFEFCPHCGQKTRDDLTMGVLFYNTISNYFSFDARFFKSFLPLMFRPGYLAKKFVEGKRLQYLHPAQYYLFVSVVFFFIFSFQAREYTQKADRALEKGFDTNPMEVIDSLPEKKLDSATLAKLTQPLKDQKIITGMDEVELLKLDSIINKEVAENKGTSMSFDYNKEKLDSLIAINAPEAEMLKAMGMPDDAGFLKRRLYTQALKFQINKGGGILQAFFDSIPIALFILLPIFAFILKIFFWRRGSFAHHLVFSFYFFSFLFLVLGLIVLVNYFVEIPDWIDWLLALSTSIYLLLAVNKFYGQGVILSFFKTGMVVFIYLLFVLPIALGIMTVSSLLFY